MAETEDLKTINTLINHVPDFSGKAEDWLNWITGFKMICGATVLRVMITSNELPKMTVNSDETHKQCIDYTLFYRKVMGLLRAKIWIAIPADLQQAVGQL